MGVKAQARRQLVLMQAESDVGAEAYDALRMLIQTAPKATLKALQASRHRNVPD